MPAAALEGIRKKRPSITDSMKTNAEKIRSGVARQLIELLDSDVEAHAVHEVWPGAPPSCLVVVPGAKGHWKYIINIKERLKAEGFKFSGEARLWYRPRLAGQLVLPEKAGKA